MNRLSALLLGSGLLFAATAVQAQNTISTLAGGGPLSGTALTAALDPPSAVVKDSAGNLYVSTFFQHTVFKLTPSGQWSVFAGVGRFGFSGDNGPATAAALFEPAGLAIDGAGNLYIADLGNQRVRRVDPNGMITTYAGNGTIGVPGQNGDGGPATSASLDGPRAMVVDGAGNLYFTDSDGNVVRKVDAVTQHISTVAGNGTIATRYQLNGDGGPATAASLHFPRGLATDSANNLYIADTLDNRVRMVNATTQIITTFVGSLTPRLPSSPNGDGGPGANAYLRQPRGLSFDASGNLYIADSNSSVIRKVDSSTQHLISTVVGNGTADFAGDGGPALNASLNLPIAIWADASGTLTIADSANLRVRFVDGSSTISTIAGGGVAGDNGPPNAAILSFPEELAFDGSGNLYVADSENQKIRKVTFGPNSSITTFAGTGITEQVPVDGLPATATKLGGPAGMAFDGNGNMYFAGGNSSFEATGASGLIRKIDPNGILTTIAGLATTLSACNLFNDPCGDGGPAVQAVLNFPYAVAVDASGNIFLSDTYLNRIRKIDANGTITTVAGTGLTCADPTTACGDGGLATSATLNLPQGMAFDPAGNLLIADTGDNKIRRINAIGGVLTPNSTITTVALNGAAVFGGNGGPALSASLAAPQGVRADAAGNIFFSGGTRYVVQRVDSASGTIATVAGNVNILAGGSIGDGGPANQASLGSAGLALDNAGGLYIADAGNNRVRYVHLTPAANFSGAFSDFGLQGVGHASPPQSITLGNTGGASLVITSIVSTANFAATNSCSGGPVAPMSGCTVSVTFTPPGVGGFAGQLTITTNDPSHPVQQFQLSGTGILAGGVGNLSAANLQFSTQNIGVASPPQAVTLTNTGNGVLTISSIAITGANPNDFSQTNNCPQLPQSLDLGTSCVFLVSFTPIAAGPRSAAVSVTDDQGGIPGSQELIGLSGTGFEPPPVAATTYRITGNPFTTFQGSAACPPSCNVSGSFTLPSPLGPNLSNATITPASFSFYVGPVVLDQNSATSAVFSGLSTDSSGSLTNWSISLSNSNNSITTSNPVDLPASDSFQSNNPQGAASNSNSPARWPKTTVTPLTFPASTAPVSSVATLNCPSGTMPCTDANAHSFKLTVPTVSSAFTLSVTAIEVPTTNADGICRKGQTEVTDFDCRLASTFGSQALPNGDILVPLCASYANGNCVFYRVGNVPPTTSYQGPVLETIAWNNNSFVPPANYQANNPRLYDDPEAAPYGANHQFVFDITEYFTTATGQVGDPLIGGHSLQFNDFVVAYPSVPSTAYSFSWVAPFGATRPASFEAGDSIPVKFKLSPNAPAGVALQTPNHAGYSVVLDTNLTGCSDYSGVLQTTQPAAGSASGFAYDALRQLYQLKLKGSFAPGRYKLLVTSNLVAEQCAAFVIRRDR